MKTLFILCCQFIGLLAVKAGSGDSVSVFHMKEIQVLASRYDFFTEGQQLISVSPLILKYYQSNSLGELLALGGQAYIKSYGGAGSLSTLSIRGASANQTQVNWNGFPLNSVTSGDVDLSLIPVQLIDEVNIHPGASGSLYGSGTFGGSVDLLNKAKTCSPFSVFFDSEIGSFHNRSVAAGVSQGFRKLGYSLSFILRNVLNDFSYPDIYKAGSPETLMTHSSLKYMGIFQNLYYYPDEHNKLELGIWYQQKMKDIPAIMGSFGSSFASQKDSSIKIFAKWTRTFLHSSLTVKSGYFTDYLHYQNGIDSKIFSRQFLSDISYRNYFSDHISGEFGIVSRLIHADVAAYGIGIFDPRLSFYGASKYSVDALSINLSVRSEITKDRAPKPVFAIGANYSLFKDVLTVRFSTSTKYRLPSLNERYWPGCNPDILPEQGWTNEAGFIYKILKQSASSLSLETQAYSSRMKSLIQWNDSTAMNFKSVWSRGIDTHINYCYTGQFLKIESGLGFEHLRSTNTDTYEGSENILGKQLRYVPQNRWNFMSQLNYSLFNFGFIYSFTGRTFVNEDNSGMILPSYSLSNIYASVGNQISGNDYQLTFRISNIFDKHYQVISAYAAPGIAFYIGIAVKFNATKKNKDLK